MRAVRNDSEIEDLDHVRHAHPAAGAQVWGCLLLALGCGHAEGAKQANTLPPRAQRSGSRGAERAASTTQESSPAEREPEAAERIEDYMVEHFVIVTWSRDAVIDGSLDALREPLSALAAYEYEHVAAGSWMPWIAQIQAAARLTSEAESLAAAATGVANMARACGGCHAALGRGPDFGSVHRDVHTLTPDTLGSRMDRHMWAADRMWQGLTGPSDAAWRAGAAALAKAPATAPEFDPPLPADFVRALDEVRELGEAASAATSLEERANVYGLFLAACAGCHAHHVELAF